ncbi:FecR domain-containing protein [Burkholderia gladioli]|uniref:FecR domain-containing protein n=1 Tax=Burkholderia gladioli TaxID=28095 RepID=UPI0038B39109
MKHEAASAIPPEIARRAVQWWVDLQGEGARDPALLGGFERWRAEHPLHEAAWCHIQTMQGRFSQLAGGVDAGAARAALLPARAPRRRTALKALAVLVGAGGAAWSLDPAERWALWNADWRTAVGERRGLTLADGTRVMLNTDSAIDVRFDAHERRIVLLRGEIMVSSGHEQRTPARPLVVAAAPGELRPLGTRFAVRLDGARVTVGVFEGAVRAQPFAAGAGARVIAAGQQAGMARDAVDVPHPLVPYAGAWIDGTLVATRLRLADLLAELARYRCGYLYCDDAVAELRVSGTYPLDDTDRVLDTLRATLPIEVEHFTRYWARVVPARG